MANTIQHKRSTTPGAKPSTSALAAGELAVNVADGRLYVERDNGGAAVVEFWPVDQTDGRYPTKASPVLTGPTTVQGVRVDSAAKGSVSSGTATFDVSAAAVQTITVAGAQTWAFTGWGSKYGEVEIIATNAGAAAITLPTIWWLKGDGTRSTTFSSMGTTLQASGVNHFLIWTPDGGTTLFGRAA